jgi:hypothetical protein
MRIEAEEREHPDPEQQVSDIEHDRSPAMVSPES